MEPIPRLLTIYHLIPRVREFYSSRSGHDEWFLTELIESGRDLTPWLAQSRSIF